MDRTSPERIHSYTNTYMKNRMELERERVCIHTFNPGGPGLPGLPCGPGGPCNTNHQRENAKRYKHKHTDFPFMSKSEVRSKH